MQTNALDALTLSLGSLAAIRLLGMLVFVDLYIQKRERIYILLILGWLCVASGSAWGLYTYTVQGALENYFFSLLAGMGTFWIYCGALRYFGAIRIRFIAIGSFLILGFGLLPLSGIRTAPSPGVFVQAFISLFVTFVVIFKRRIFQKFARSSYVWLVALAVMSDGLTLAFAFGVIPPDMQALGFAGTSLLQVVALIFFLHLEYSLSTRQLQISESNYRKMVQNLMEGFYASTLDGVLLEYNREFTNILELDANRDHRGVSLPEHWLDPADYRRYLDALTQQGSIKNYRVTTKTASGKTIELMTNSQLVESEDGKPPYIEGTFLDVTARVQAEEQQAAYTGKLEKDVERRTHALRQAQEQLIQQEKLAVTGRLAGSVGHELRNPLGVITNAIYFLKLVLTEAGEKVREYLDLIENESQHANGIINNLLDFSHPTTPDRKPVSVRELADIVLSRYPAPQGAHVTLDLPADLPPVHVDERQAARALGNLALNAWQAMREGGELEIKARAAPGEGQGFIAMALTDNGGGVSPENMRRLFEPLFTTKPMGIGLGLAASKTLVEANGGRIQAHSQEGVGSTFTLFLPVREEIGA